MGSKRAVARLETLYEELRVKFNGVVSSHNMLVDKVVMIGESIKHLKTKGIFSDEDIKTIEKAASSVIKEMRVRPEIRSTMENNHGNSQLGISGSASSGGNREISTSATVGADSDATGRAVIGGLPEKSSPSDTTSSPESA